MKINTETLSPWADIHRMVSQMSSLRVVVGDEEYAGEAEIDLDTNTCRLTIRFAPHHTWPRYEYKDGLADARDMPLTRARGKHDALLSEAHAEAKRK